MQSTVAEDWQQNPETQISQQKRSLAGACLAHLVHDGYTDQLYTLLPIWQSEFGLSYTGLAIIRALYSGTMGGLQVPAGKLTARLSPRAVLTLATFIAAAGLVVMALPFGLPSLCVGLIISGVGSSLQHPRASLLVTQSYGATSRSPLGIYNFSGDLGKASFPAIVAVLLLFIAWRPVVGVMAAIGVASTLALLALMPGQLSLVPKEKSEIGGGTGRGFVLLFTIGAFDTATRMSYLLFLPFLLHEKGSSEATIGIGLALLFAGGALGKACCGWLGERLGVVATVVTTEALTAFFMITTLKLPLVPTLIILPVLGIVLNGTSSVLYGTVPELSKRGEVGKAFALFYTGVLCSGGIAPIVYGAIADQTSQTIGILAAAITAAAIIPMVMLLRPFLHPEFRKAN